MVCYINVIWERTHITLNTAMCMPVHQEGMRAQPPFPSQATEKRVVRLPPGRPALLPLPAPNEDNANSAVVLAFQV
jgi:hypothetical protein